MQSKRIACFFDVHKSKVLLLTVSSDLSLTVSEFGWVMVAVGEGGAHVSTSDNVDWSDGSRLLAPSNQKNDQASLANCETTAISLSSYGSVRVLA
jgi:hypothetical protein